MSAQALQSDRDVVSAAVQQNGLALYFASPRLRRDKEMAAMRIAACGKCATLCLHVCVCALVVLRILSLTEKTRPHECFFSVSIESLR